MPNALVVIKSESSLKLVMREKHLVLGGLLVDIGRSVVLLLVNLVTESVLAGSQAERKLVCEVDNC